MNSRLKANLLLSKQISRTDFHSSLLVVALQRLECLLDQLTPQLFLRSGGHAGSPHDVHDAVTKHDSVSADHLSDGNGRSNLNCRDTRLLQFRCDRSAAARAGPSSRGENDGIDPQLLCPLGHLAPHPTSIGEGIGQTRRRDKLVV